MKKNDELRIAHITTGYPNSKELHQGIFVKRLINALYKYCTNYTYAPLPRTFGLGPYKHLAKEPPVTHVPKGMIYRNRFTLLPGYKRKYHTLGRTIKEAIRDDLLMRSVHVIHAHWAYPDGHAAYLLHSETGIPYVIHARGYKENHTSKEHPLVGQILREVYEHAHAVIAHNESLAEQCIILGARPENIRIIPNGVDDDVYTIKDTSVCRRTLDLPRQAPLILYTGGYRWNKGIQRLLKTLDDATPDKAVFVFIETYPRDKRMHSKLLPHVRDGTLIIRPHQHPQKMVEYYNACDFLYTPSISEGRPNTVIEAQLCGLPVLASNIPAHKELVPADNILPEEEHLFFVYSMLRRTERKSAVRERMQQQTISWDEQARRVHEVYDRIK